MELLIGLALMVAVFVTIKVLMTNARRAKLLAKYGDNLTVERIMRHEIWQGMSRDQLFDSIGSPVDTQEKVFKQKTVHTYMYNQDGTRRFRTRVTAENGQVVGWTQR